MHIYKVLVDLYSADEAVEVKVLSEANLNNCDEDMLMNDIQDKLEQMFGEDDIAHFELV